VVDDNATYEPNHFVLLVPCSDVPSASISVIDDERTDNLDKNTPVNVETDHAADNDTDDVNSTTSDDSDLEVDDNGDENHQDEYEDQDPDTVIDGQMESAVGIARLPDDDWLVSSTWSTMPVRRRVRRLEYHQWAAM